MGRYYYPTAKEALDAKKMFLREHGYKIPHCFQNTWGTGYVLFDSKYEVNAWWKEHTGEYFYKEEYEPGTTFTEQDALREVEQSYGRVIDEALRQRDYSMPLLAVGLPFSYGNSMLLKFVPTNDEKDIAYRFYLHYDGYTFDVNPNISNASLRQQIIRLIYKNFYASRFKKRIEGSNAEKAKREEERRKIEAERREREAARIQRERELERARIQREEVQKREAERELRYREAYSRYCSEMSKYEKEIAIYNKAMALKKSFTHGGQYPNSAGTICFFLTLAYIFVWMMVFMTLGDILPYTPTIIIAIIFIVLGYRLINNKLKPYLADERFDEQGFQSWCKSNPNSPLIRYVRNSWPPSKPTPPSR